MRYLVFFLMILSIHGCALDCADNNWIKNDQSYYLKVEKYNTFKGFLCINDTILLNPSYNEIGKSYLHQTINVNDSLSIEKFKDTIWLFRGNSRYWYRKNIQSE